MIHWLAHALDPIRSVCGDWCLHFWEVVGVWFTGAATFTAVIVSLRLARRQSAPQLRVEALKRVYISGVPKGTPSIKVSDYPDVIAVEAVNKGLIPVKVIAIWWTVYIPPPLRWFWPRIGALLQNAPDEEHRSHGLPATLGPTDMLQWVLDLDRLSGQVVAKLLAPSPLWRLRLRQLRVCARTSVDVTIWGPLDADLVADLKERTIQARNPGHGARSG